MILCGSNHSGLPSATKSRPLRPLGNSVLCPRGAARLRSQVSRLRVAMWSSRSSAPAKCICDSIDDLRTMGLCTRLLHACCPREGSACRGKRPTFISSKNLLPVLPCSLFGSIQSSLNVARCTVCHSERGNAIEIRHRTGGVLILKVRKHHGTGPSGK